MIYEENLDPFVNEDEDSPEKQEEDLGNDLPKDEEKDDEEEL